MAVAPRVETGAVAVAPCTGSFGSLSVPDPGPLPGPLRQCQGPVQEEISRQTDLVVQILQQNSAQAYRLSQLKLHHHHLRDIDMNKGKPPWNDVTTVIMVNVPKRYLRGPLLEELSDKGFTVGVDFDFLDLPMKSGCGSHTNLGYCFINFVRTSIANAFAEAFSGKKLCKFNSKKTVSVMPASIQGYENNFIYYPSTKVTMAHKRPQCGPTLTHVLAGTHGAQTSHTRPLDCSHHDVASDSIHDDGLPAGCLSSNVRSCAASTDLPGPERMPRTSDSSAHGHKVPPGLELDPAQTMKTEAHSICSRCNLTFDIHFRFCVACGNKLQQDTGGVTALQPPADSPLRGTPMYLPLRSLPGRVGGTFGGSGREQPGAPPSREFWPPVPGMPQHAEESSRPADGTLLRQLDHVTHQPHHGQGLCAEQWPLQQRPQFAKQCDEWDLDATRWNGRRTVDGRRGLPVWTQQA